MGYCLCSMHVPGPDLELLPPASSPCDRQWPDDRRDETEEVPIMRTDLGYDHSYDSTYKVLPAIQTQELEPWHGSLPAQVSFRGVLRIASAVAVLVTLHLATKYFGAAQWGTDRHRVSAIIVLFTVLEDFGLEYFVVARQIAFGALLCYILFSASLALRLVLAVAACRPVDRHPQQRSSWVARLCW